MIKILPAVLVPLALLLNACSDNAALSKDTTAAKINTNNSSGILKGKTDKREYAFKKLENGLNVIVVSDPDADKAAASLDVHIGHLSDPADREGLTHFLEHMLFLGTEKYPEVGEYSKFVSKHGGNVNAGTGQEHTNYFFQIDNGFLEPALDRFSQFFIAPLFAPEFVDKERNAVQSEYSLKIKEDARRYREAVKQTANQAHPMTQFSVGNLETLSDTETSQILDAVKAQYDTFYSADIMSLSIIGNYPTSELMKWAENKFTDVPSKGDTRIADRPAPYSQDQLGVKIEVNTLEEDYSVRLYFALPSDTQAYLTKPVRYIAQQLGHKGEGTLHHTIKEKGYLKYFNTATWGPDDYTDFSVNIGLTKSGYEHVDEVIDYFFSYVELIRRDGVNKETYEEIATIKALNFDYKDKFSVASTARNLSGNLQYYPPKHALDISRTYYDFDEKLIQNYLSIIKPENARIVIAGPDIKSDTKEARYDVPYSMSKIAADDLNTWSRYDRVSEFNLPKKNGYIAKNLTLTTQEKITIPKLTYEKTGIKLWHVNQNEFGLPKASLNFRLYSPQAYKNDEYKVALPLHGRIIADILNSESYAAAQAGLYYNVSGSVRSYNISVQGYNDKIDAFLGKVLTSLAPAAVKKDVFERVKENYIQDIKNREFSRPISQVFSALRVESDAISLDEAAQLKALSDLDYDTFLDAITELQNQMEIEGVYNGNIAKKDTKKIGDILTRNFAGRLKSGIKLKVSNLTIAATSTSVREINVDHNDSTIVWMWQGDNTSYEEKAKYRAIVQILKSRFYKSLRTEQQYGYVVGMTSYSFDQVPATGFYIQSPKAHPAILKDKIQEFMVAQTQYLTNLTEEDFQSNLEGLLSNINKKFDNIYAKGGALHSQLITENYGFDDREKLSAAIHKLTRADLVSFYKTEILDDASRSMILWNIGNAHKDEKTYNPAQYNICTKAKCIYKTSL